MLRAPRRALNQQNNLLREQRDLQREETARQEQRNAVQRQRETSLLAENRRQHRSRYRASQTRPRDNLLGAYPQDRR